MTYCGSDVVKTAAGSLSGAYVNPEYPLMNGTTVKLLNDSDVYLGNQLLPLISKRPCKRISL